MIKKIFPFLALLFCVFISPAQEISLRKGMTIKRSAKVKKGTYLLVADTSFQKPLLTVEGDNIVIDFNNAALQGSRGGNRPDEFVGLAILIRNSKNVTLKNLKARGFKVALLAQNVDSLTLDNCDFSYNYRQHLNSTQEKEDLSDWMSYHHNEKDEWLRYGAAMYLRGCNNAVIKNCKVTGGQNALMLMECNNGLIYNNDFSFNSGIGLGLYRSSGNKVLYNKLNFNVRGYSHGIYNRGQDSAGILVYEQSSNNLFYKNSVTHSGDGFFLWAGQTTMDTGEGGCNDNILLQNDFSYAPTNGIEATFSRNQFIHNRVFECDHGIWGGYSYDTRISNNQFRNNRIAIAIEHGQGNTINHNLFYGNREAIRLWARAQQPADWVYAQKRDTRSRNYIITSNSFNSDSIVYNLVLTDSLAVFSNRYNNCTVLFKGDTSVANIDREYNDEEVVALSKEDSFQIPFVTNPANPFKGSGALAGRKNIRMTEWGPYDFQYPLIWNSNPTGSSDTMQFDLLGPKGKWKIVSVKGISKLSAKTGSFPARLTAQKKKGSTQDIQIIAEYIGPSFVDAMGKRTTTGKPQRFIFKKFFQPIDWQVKWYSFDSTTNPVVKPERLKELTVQPPLKTEQVNKLDYAWWGGIKAGEQHPRFVTLAEGTAEVAPGTYELSVTWDDAVRVYVDEKLLLDEWNPALYQFDESPNKKIRLKLAGKHHIRVEHAELGGFATLSLKLNKVN